MSIDPDDFDFDYERSRAAVAIACLQWLRCTGPAAGMGEGREMPVDVADPSPIAGLEQPPDPGYSPHPLWDRWIDN